MKANELMIGDWVKPFGSHEGVYAKITSITPNRIDMVTTSKNLHHETAEYTYPIPLTPEILEKNGFKRDPLWHHCDKDLDNYSISVQLGYANRIEYIKIVEKGKDNVIPSERTKMYLTHIKYIHELQRALRLLKTNEDIVL